MSASRVIEVSSQGIAEVRRTESAIIYEAGGKIMELSETEIYYIEENGRIVDTQTGVIIRNPSPDTPLH